MIGNIRIDEAITRHLPPGTTIVPAPWDEYVAFALHQPIIQLQLELGIYDRSTIKKELATVAWSWPHIRSVAVCHDLIRWHMRDVPLMFGYGYAESIGIHEAHHLAHHTEPPRNMKQQIERELECSEVLEAHHPGIASLATRATELSPTLKLVTNRSRRLIGGQHGRRPRLSRPSR